MFYVYVLRSIKNGNLYIGWLPDLKARVAKHNKGKVPATKPHIPYQLVYYEAYLSEKDSHTRERYLKSGWGRNYLKRTLVDTLKVIGKKSDIRARPPKLSGSKPE